MLVGFDRGDDTPTGMSVELKIWSALVGEAIDQTIYLVG